MEVKKICYLVGLISLEIAEVISDLFYVGFSPILAPKPNSIKIG